MNRRKPKQAKKLLEKIERIIPLDERIEIIRPYYYKGEQFCAGDNELNAWYDQYWENQLFNSGLTDRDIELWQERRKFDRECSVEEETDMLTKSGFKIVKCIYAYQKFAVIMAIK